MENYNPQRLVEKLRPKNPFIIILRNKQDYIIYKLNHLLWYCLHMSVFAKCFQQIENKMKILSNQNKARLKALSVSCLLLCIFISFYIKFKRTKITLKFKDTGKFTRNKYFLQTLPMNDIHMVTRIFSLSENSLFSI